MTKSPNSFVVGTRADSSSLHRSLRGLRTLLAASFVVFLVLGNMTTVQVLASPTSSPLTQANNDSPKNLVLFYDDYPTRVGDPDRTRYQVTRETVRPLIANLDTTGQPTDWLFDSFIFMSAKLYGSEVDPPTQKYIDSWIKYLFRERQVQILDTTVGELRAQLGQPSYQLKVFFEIPVDASNIDRSPMDNINKLLNEWKKLKAQNLELVGFCWGFSESLWPGYPTLPGVIQKIADLLHSKGLKLLFIPWRAAPGYERLHSLGVDYVTMQPNFAKSETNDMTWFSQVDSIVKAGLADGVELELVGPGSGPGDLTCCGRDWYVNHVTYLEQAMSYNWQSNLLTTYYYGNAVSPLASGGGPNYRLAYEMIYQYIEATTAPAA